MKIFYDTCAFCALVIPEDNYHRTAIDTLAVALTKSPALFTSNYVLDETYTLIRARRGHFASVSFMKNFSHLGITVLRVSEEIEETAAIIFRKYDLDRLSFTDCTSFAIINAYRIDHVFSFDEHFRHFRFKHQVTIL